MDNTIDLGKKDEIMKALKDSGFRMTKQRDLIVSAILEKCDSPVPPGIQEVLSKVQEQDGSIGMATVYRTVEVLSRLGFVSLIDQGDGFNRITLAEGKITIHAFCRCCGKSVPVPEEEKLIEVISSLVKGDKFTLLPQTFRICGLCSDCRDSDIARDLPGRRRGRGQGRGCRCRGGKTTD
ncbi:MAG: transcriptional repressor [Synergistales bacterium]|nr:Fur family transcriptional regulator [Dethiosulfovibrio sp.]NCC96205.1 transcriptional repressor [Synergistales bacterium]